MADGKKFESSNGFIGAVQLAIDLTYVCMMEWDTECGSLWKFFETLYGINITSRHVSANILKIVNGLLEEDNFSTDTLARNSAFK